jgi:hypothetical protein
MKELKEELKEEMRQYAKMDSMHEKRLRSDIDYFIDSYYLSEDSTIKELLCMLKKAREYDHPIDCGDILDMI